MKFVKILSLVTAIFLISGCGGDNTERNVDRIKILNGANQSALPGEEFARPMVIELTGPLRPGLLGGSGTRNPVAGKTVHFVPQNGSDLVITPATVKTDSAGSAVVKVKAGKKTGDHYVKIFADGFENKSVTVRFSTGLKISGADQEERSGTVTQDPLTVKVVDENGKPIAGVPVFFSIGTTPEGGKSKAALCDVESSTNANGEASARLKLGQKTGEYNVNIEIADPARGMFLRGKSVRILGINPISVAIAVLGGLTIFVFGMKLMGDGLQRIAGENMRKLLQFFARNGVVAVLAGTLVTAVIQSSSATTVMVIGFINAGLLTLKQAIGIIFGANIGTTVTAQIISFNISGVALPAITIGFFISLARKPSVRGWGETILGFGLLFFGMSMMSDELKMLGEFPTFCEFFRSFDCAPAVPGGFMPMGAILGAIGIGIAATVLIQSSSAAMGIVLALAASGLVNFYTAVPLLLGTNIGTTVTAFLASLAANRVAKQAAIAHLLFNVFGTAVMLGLFFVPYGPDRIPVFLYFINAITPGNVFAAIPQGVERHIAMAHTFFNITVTVILLPFIGVFTKVCEILLPVKDKDKLEIQPLEPHLLATPSMALEQVVHTLKDMVSDAWKMVDEAINENFMKGEVDEQQEKDLERREERIDRLQSEITAYLVRITRRNLTRPQSELVPLLMHCTNDAERIADHTANIMELTRRMSQMKETLSETAVADLNQIWNLLNYEAKNVVSALGSSDGSKVSRALKSESKINNLTEKYESAHIERLREGKCNLALSVIFIEMLAEMEKLGDHLSNIAERALEIQKHYIKL